MEIDEMTDAKPGAAQVLVQMHQLLWQASVEAHARARRNRDVKAVDLAFNLSHLYALVYELVPGAFREALLDRPEVTGADPLDLARQVDMLSRTEPIHHFPPGIAPVLVLLSDTLRDFS